MRRRWELATVAIALTAGAVLLATVEQTPAPAGPVTLANVWPHATVGELPGRLADGAPYEPLLRLDGDTTLATAPTPERDRVRLVHFSGDDPTVLRELRSLPGRRQPRYLAATTSPGWLVWAEATTEEPGQLLRIWALPPSGDPVALTADTGAASFDNSQYDLVITDRRVHWVAAAPTGGTELRSVPLTGGAVSTRPLPGDWSLADWPWLVSTTGTTDRPTLRHLDNGQLIEVPVTAGELVSCSVRWCRALRPAGTDPARIELHRPDGTDRRPLTADQPPSSPLVDVALLDRYEVWTTPGLDGSPTSNQQLFLYDLANDQSVRLATGVGQVRYGNGYLWWSTGQSTTRRWHTLDLTGL